MVWSPISNTYKLQRSSFALKYYSFNPISSTRSFFGVSWACSRQRSKASHLPSSQLIVCWLLIKILVLVSPCECCVFVLFSSYFWQRLQKLFSSIQTFFFLHRIGVRIAFAQSLHQSVFLYRDGFALVTTYSRLIFCRINGRGVRTVLSELLRFYRMVNHNSVCSLNPSSLL